MPPLAKLQFVGPFVLLAVLAGAEAASFALALSPSSEIIWYVHTAVFGSVRRLIGMPLFLLACGGLRCKCKLPLAISSSLTFVYATSLIASCSALQTDPDHLVLFLLATSLLSFAISHIVYIRDIRTMIGARTSSSLTRFWCLRPQFFSMLHWST